MTTLENAREWAFSLATEIAANESIRINEDMLRQYINFKLSYVTEGYVDDVVAWTKAYDKEFNGTMSRFNGTKLRNRVKTQNGTKPR